MQEIKDAFNEHEASQAAVDRLAKDARESGQERLAQANRELLAQAEAEKAQQSTSDAPSGTVWDAIDAVATEMHKTAAAKGWYDPPKSIGEQIAMWHSEISEALEETRGGQPLEMVWFQVDKTLIDKYLREEANQSGPDMVRDVIYKYWEYATDVGQNGEEATAEAPTPGDMEILVRAGIAKPEGFSIEAADAVIRIMDTLEYNGISLGQAIRLKAVYNATRPHRHGGKVL